MGGKREASTVPELEQDFGFQSGEWRFQRLGWAALALIVLFSGLGLLGPGLLTRTETVQGDLAIGYDRIIRREAPFVWEVRLRPGPDRGSFSLALSPGCLQDSEVAHIVPDPDSALAGDAGAVTWVFRLDPAAAEARVVVTLRARDAGPRACRIAADGAAAAEFRQWSLP